MRKPGPIYGSENNFVEEIHACIQQNQIPGLLTFTLCIFFLIGRVKILFQNIDSRFCKEPHRVVGRDLAIFTNCMIMVGMSEASQNLRFLANEMRMELVFFYL